jgi:hypothetical protein
LLTLACLLTVGSLVLVPAAAHDPVAVDSKNLFMNTVVASVCAYPLPEDDYKASSSDFTTLTYGDETWVNWKNNGGTTVTIFNVSYAFRLRHLANLAPPELVHHHQVVDTTIMVEPNATNTIPPPSFSDVFQPDPGSYTIEATTTMSWSTFDWEAQHHHDWTQE